MAKWATIGNPLNSTNTMFGGRWGNDISRYLNGIDMGAIDSDKEPIINTNTRYRYGKLKLYDIDATHTVEFQVENIISGSHRVLKIRAPVANPDYIVTESQPATITDKKLGTNSSLGAVLDADQNSIIRIDTVGLRDITGDNVNFANIEGTGANSQIHVLKNYAGILGATDIKMVFGESSKINAYEWYSTIPGPNTKLFDILPNQVNIYTDLDMNNQQILNYIPDIPENHILNEDIGAHTSTKITITDKALLNPNIVYNDQANTFGAHNQTFPSGNLRIAGNGGFASSILSGILGGNINITLPNVTGTLALTSDSRFTDARTPTLHATSHTSGSDLIRVNELGAPTVNNPATNATNIANGTLPMLSGDGTQFLNGVGGWSVPSIPAGQYTGNIKGNTATASGNGTAKVFTIAHGLTTIPASAIVKPSSIDAFGEFETAIDATNITITYQFAPPAGTSNLKWQWIAMDPAAHQVVNSYSTVGGGAALTKVKLTSDLPFRSLLAGSNKITLVQNENDITFNIDESQFTTERPPIDHATDHKNGGTDVIKINELAASTTNNPATNSTETVNGTMPILHGDGDYYLNGLGQWTVPTGLGGGAGESNTVSNLVGTAGYVGLYKQKTLVDFELKSLNVGSNKLSILDDTANNQVVFDVIQENLVIDYSQITNPPEFVRADQGNIFGDFQQTFPSAGIKIMNVDNTFGTIITNSNITGANKSLRLPPITIPEDVVVVENLGQTLLNKTLVEPVIAKIKIGADLLTLPVATDQLVGRITQDVLENKELIAPKIATISNGNAILTLPVGPDQLMGRNTQDAVTQKTISLAQNTITEVGAQIGGIPMHNGTKYVNKSKGADGTFLGVQSGVVGYYTLPIVGGGSLPDGSPIPSTGRWGAFWGGTYNGDGLLNMQSSYNSLGFETISPTETASVINTASADDAIAYYKSGEIFSRQSNVVFKAEWHSKQNTNCCVRIGFSSQATLPTGSSHDNPVDDTTGVMIIWVSDIESNYRVGFNNGVTTSSYVPTTIPANNTTKHSCEIQLLTTGIIVRIDGVEVVNNTGSSNLPPLTTPMHVYAHIESIGTGNKGLAIRWMQVKCL